MSRFSGVEEEILTLASRAFILIEKQECTLDDLLERREFSHLRRTLSHLLLNCCKYRKAIESELAKYIRSTPRPEIRALLCVALTQAMVQDRISPEAVINVAVEAAKKYRTSGFVNAVLRKALAGLRRSGLPAAYTEILPDTIIRRWEKRFSNAEIQQLADAFLCQPEFTFRMEHKTAPESFAFTPVDAVTPEFPFGKAAPPDVLESEEFKSGRLYIQDPAASLAVSLAPERKFDSILDLCSAPGGKALMLLEKYPDTPRFISFDRSAARQKLTRKNFDLRGIKHTVSSDPAVLTGKFDLIMIDAPCSNTGVFRRRPDALWRFSEQSLADTVKIQRELLEKAYRMLNPGGYILYSTCSIEPEENDMMVGEFTAAHRQFSVESSCQLLPDASHDGAFAALLYCPAQEV